MPEDEVKVFPFLLLCVSTSTNLLHRIYFITCQYLLSDSLVMQQLNKLFRVIKGYDRTLMIPTGRLTTCCNISEDENRMFLIEGSETSIFYQTQQPTAIITIFSKGAQQIDFYKYFKCTLFSFIIVFFIYCNNI